MSKLRIGCIADDFTGASDAASFLSLGGMNTILTNGVPTDEICLDKNEAVVIALKTRNIEVNMAVDTTLEALEWLLEKGAKQIYIKYCSTFDSRKDGNIGPIIDAVMERLGEQKTLICPSLPINGRTVKNGHLYVNGIPLHESSMKNHPITPMWDSSIPNLMYEQGRFPCIVLNRYEMSKPTDVIQEFVITLEQEDKCFYIVPEYENGEDAKKIVEVFGDFRCLTGGSGLLEELARQKKSITIDSKEEMTLSNKGNTLVLVGSCSEMTLKQIDDYERRGWISQKISPLDVLLEKTTPQVVVELLQNNENAPIMIYCSDSPENVAAVKEKSMGKNIATILEDYMAKIAEAAYQEGCRKIIVAGGETSGAITKKLGFQNYQIGKSIAPGIPILTPVDHLDTKLVLKSGNFGQEDFFYKTIQILNKTQGDDYE